MKIEPHSNTWEVVRKHARDGIAAATKRLETNLDLAETNIERGKIMALRDVLKLAEPTDRIRDEQLRASFDPAGY
jgi:hypothetical protein